MTRNDIKKHMFSNSCPVRQIRGVTVLQFLGITLHVMKPLRSEEHQETYPRKVPSLFIHVPSPFLFQVICNFRERTVRETLTHTRTHPCTHTVGEEKRLGMFSDRNEGSWSRLLSCEAVTAQFKTFWHAKQPKALKLVIWLLFEHHGISFTSRAGDFKLW